MSWPATVTHRVTPTHRIWSCPRCGAALSVRRRNGAWSKLAAIARRHLKLHAEQDEKDAIRKRLAEQGDL